MKLPEEVVIPQAKLLRFLLIPREVNDKSGFLRIAGYTQDNWEVLDRDLRQLIQTYEVSEIQDSPYGIKYKVRGTITGPNGQTLRVVTIWIKLRLTGETQFVTLFPDRR